MTRYRYFIDPYFSLQLFISFNILLNLFFKHFNCVQGDENCDNCWIWNILWSWFHHFLSPLLWWFLSFACFIYIIKWLLPIAEKNINRISEEHQGTSWALYMRGSAISTDLGLSIVIALFCPRIPNLNIISLIPVFISKQSIY